MTINQIQNPGIIDVQNNIIAGPNQMNLKIISLVLTVSYLFIIIGIIVAIIYMIKSKKDIIKKLILGAIIILVPVITTITLGLVKTNMVMNEENETIQNSISNVNNDIQNYSSNNNSEFWISKYTNFSEKENKVPFELCGTEQKRGITTPINLEKIEESSENYTYHLYTSAEKFETENLSDIYDVPLSRVSGESYLIDFYGEGLSFRECMEQGKFSMQVQSDLSKKSFNISSYQIGLNIKNENIREQSDVLDALIQKYGAPNKIEANKSLKEAYEDKSITYELIYEYDEYVVVLYINETIYDDERTCEIKNVYYFPKEIINNNTLKGKNTLK